MRVIYSWQVEPERMEAFEAAWRETTRAIHRDTEGALGSFCLRSLDDPKAVLTVALWESEVQWRAFIETAKSGSMKRMHDLGKQVSAKAYHQLGDETVMTAPRRTPL